MKPMSDKTPRRPRGAPAVAATVAATVDLPADNGGATATLADELPDTGAVGAWLTLGGVENQDSVTVYRQPETGAAEFLFTVSAETQPDSLMRRLQRDYGSGQYRFQVRQGGRIVKNSLVPIAAEPAPREEAINLPQLLLTQLQAQQNMTTSVITAALGRPQAAERKTDVVGILSAAAPLVAPVIGGIVDLMKGAKPDPIDLFTKFAKLRDLLAGVDFTGMEPRQLDVLHAPKQHDVYYKLGTLLAVEYECVKDGKRLSFRHPFKKKARPALAVSPDGQQLGILGGEFQVTDHGIVDDA